jgi:hypothetical protein
MIDEPLNYSALNVSLIEMNQAAFNLLAQANFSLRDCNKPPITKLPDIKSYLKQYATVEIFLPPRSGVTTWIFSKANTADLLIIPESSQFYRSHSGCPIFTEDYVETLSMRREAVPSGKNIFVDGCRLSTDAIINALGKNVDQTFFIFRSHTLV